MRSRKTFRRFVSCGIFIMVFLAFSVFASPPVIVKDHNSYNSNVVKSEVTLLPTSMITYLTGGVQKNEQSDNIASDTLTYTQYDNTVSESESAELEALRLENTELQKTIGEMEKTIAKYKKNNAALNQEVQELREELNEYKEKEQPEPEEMVARLDASDVRITSGASPETLNIILEGTWLEGYGETFYQYEQEYGINALFSIGNAILETGWKGNSYLARNKNNIYGLNMSRKFESYADCIDYWFRLISKHYVGEGYTSMGSIQKKYCPPNSSWDEQIVSITERLRTKADITIE